MKHFFTGFVGGMILMSAIFGGIALFIQEYDKAAAFLALAAYLRVTQPDITK